jgi:hypothetical protein
MRASRLSRIAALTLAVLVLANPSRSVLAAQDPTGCTNVLIGTCTSTWGTSVVVPATVLLSLSTATSTLAPPSAADYNAGVTLGQAGPTLRVQSNVPWRVHMQATTPTNWTATNTVAGITARTTKPITDLEWSHTVSSAFAPVPAVTTAILSGTAQNGAITYPIYFRTRWNWTLDTPGSYSQTLAFSLTSP